VRRSLTRLMGVGQPPANCPGQVVRRRTPQPRWRTLSCLKQAPDGGLGITAERLPIAMRSNPAFPLWTDQKTTRTQFRCVTLLCIQDTPIALAVMPRRIRDLLSSCFAGFSAELLCDHSDPLWLHLIQCRVVHPPTGEGYAFMSFQSWGERSQREHGLSRTGRAPA